MYIGYMNRDMEWAIRKCCNKLMFCTGYCMDCDGVCIYDFGEKFIPVEDDSDPDDLDISGLLYE